MYVPSPCFYYFDKGENCKCQNPSMNMLDCHEGKHHVNKLAHIHQTLNTTLKHKGGKKI
jgi:hypothetical protein